jgi:glycerol-3-phosphate O-acyltransferase 3/4
MTAWCVVCDVRFLDPVSIREGESAVDFANRVQDLVAKCAGMTAVPYDGYLKYWKPSEKFIQVRGCGRGGGRGCGRGWGWVRFCG